MTFPRKAVKKAVRIRFAFHQPFMLRVKKSVKSRLFRVSWWSGIDLSVLSPKPLVVGSSPTAPANKKETFVYQKFLFCLSKHKQIDGQGPEPIRAPGFFSSTTVPLHFRESQSLCFFFGLAAKQTE